MSNKIYKGVRQGVTARVFVDTEELSFAAANELHPSESTAEWAYFGSGPSQTALAILYDATGDRENSLLYYHDFKFEFIANAQYDGFIILQSQIQNWLTRRIESYKNPPPGWLV